MLPSEAPEAIDHLSKLEGFEGAKWVERLRFALDYGAANVHVLYPQEDSGRLLLLNAGHQPLADLAEATRMLLERGFVVALLAMPLYSPNEGNLKVLLQGQLHELRRHNDLARLEQNGYPALRLFFEPISRTIAHLQRERTWRLMAIAGISGGGWTADVYKALDPRLDAAVLDVWLDAFRDARSPRAWGLRAAPGPAAVPARELQAAVRHGLRRLRPPPDLL